MGLMLQQVQHAVRTCAAEVDRRTRSPPFLGGTPNLGLSGVPVSKSIVCKPSLDNLEPLLGSASLNVHRRSICSQAAHP
jgi:hypothetical protein